jgi:hypothetical protein
MNAIDAISLAVHPVKAVLIFYIERNQQKTGDTNC